MIKKGIQTHIQGPVLNDSHHDAVLQPKVTLGSFHQIQSISPLESLKLTDREKQKLVLQCKTADTTHTKSTGSIFSRQHR